MENSVEREGKPVDFTQNELDRMRKQAVKKAFEMQKRSKTGTEETPGEIIFEKTDEGNRAKNDYVNTVLKNSSRAEVIKASVPFSAEKEEKKEGRTWPGEVQPYDDRLMILAIIIILAENNADRLLILALFYIMM